MARITIGTPNLPPVKIGGMQLDIQLSYRGGDGKETQRGFTVHGSDGHLLPDGTVELVDLRGYCHLRKMARTFRFERISAAADSDGVVIADLASWIRAHAED